MDFENNEKTNSPKKKVYNLRKKKNTKKKYKLVTQSDSDSDSDDDDWIPENDAPLDQFIEEEESSDMGDESDEEEMNTLEMQKFIQKIFPSKSGKKRIKQLEK